MGGDYETPFNWRKNVYVLAFASSCTAASYTMLVPFLPLYLLELGAPEDRVALYSGAVFSVAFLVAAIMAPVWGKMADQRGKKLMAVRACAGLTIAYFLGGIVTSPLQLFGMRVVQGFANGFLPMVLAIASASAPPDRLGYALGIAQTGQIIGGVLGPLIGGVIAELIGMRLSFFVASGFLLLVTLMVLLLVKEPAASQETASARPKKMDGSIMDDFRYAWSNRHIMGMLILSFIISLANMVLQPVISLYVAALQHSMENVVFTSGLVFSLGGIAGAISTAPWGNFGQRHGYFRVMAMAFLGAGVFNFLQYFPTTISGFAICQFFFGLFFVGANPAVSAILVQASPENFRGRVFGLATTANQSGAMVGPLIGSLISTYFGIRDVFLVTGPVLFCIGFWLWQKRERRRIQ
jgi:MFS transporter, DHA1 family, multidrug resistance protein